jgi:hypothetical protein
VLECETAQPEEHINVTHAHRKSYSSNAERSSEVVILDSQIDAFRSAFYGKTSFLNVCPFDHPTCNTACKVKSTTLCVSATRVFAVWLYKVLVCLTLHTQWIQMYTDYQNCNHVMVGPPDVQVRSFIISKCAPMIVYSFYQASSLLLIIRSPNHLTRLSKHAV